MAQASYSPDDLVEPIRYLEARLAKLRIAGIWTRALAARASGSTSKRQEESEPGFPARAVPVTYASDAEFLGQTAEICETEQL